MREESGHGHERGGIIVQRGGRECCLDIETFLVGTLGTTIDVTEEEEVLKAQAVLLRSTLYYQKAKLNKEYLSAKECGMIFLDDRAWKQYYKESFREKMKHIKKAVRETEGIVICYKEKPIMGTYSAMSPGETQLEKDLFPYLKQVKCESNLLEKTFVNRYKVVQKNLEIMPLAGTKQCVVSDDGTKYNCFEYAYANKLASPYFFESNLSYGTITTKGLGHGFGMDQYYAKKVAAKDKIDFMQLLELFFQDITFEKMNW